MPEGNSIISLGNLSKPATVLIEKISEAVGAIFAPMQIKRIAKAEAYAQIIKANNKIEINEIEERALQRLIHEETRCQKNIESITSKALLGINENAEPEKLTSDWIAFFFEKCRNVSDNEMQDIWAKVLTEETNSNGSFSRRTISLISNLEKQDAELFIALSRFSVKINSHYYPLVYDLNNEIYFSNRIHFGILNHLDTIGLITLDLNNGYDLVVEDDEYENITYFGEKIQFDGMKMRHENKFVLGSVILTDTGFELAQICNPEPIEGFVTYLNMVWGE